MEKKVGIGVEPTVHFMRRLAQATPEPEAALRRMKLIIERETKKPEVLREKRQYNADNLR